MLSEEFINKYYQYIKVKAKIYQDENFCINKNSKGKAKFFSLLEANDLLEQLESVQNLFKSTLEVQKNKNF